MAEINNDPIKKLGEQADEIVDILAELGQAVNAEASPQPLPAEEPIEEVAEEPIEEPVEEPKEEAVEKPAEEPVEEPVEEPIEEVVEEPIEEPVEEPAKEEPTQEPTQEPTCKPTCKCHKWVCWVIGALLLLGVVGTGVYFRATLMQWWQCMQDCQPTTEEVTVVEEVVEVKELTLAEKPREYVNFIGIEQVGKDSRLAWIAYKYYAQKDLWVFIYEANRDIIKHPSHVREGQVIRIPELSEEYRNLYNPELKQLVDSLAVEYLKK
jgi:hypothetical protein